MKEMLEKFKKSKSSLALIILALVLIIAGISFALFNPSINLIGRRNIKISKCELDINFKESDELMLISKYPISTRQALEGNYKPKTVTITNNSTCDTAYYKLTIKDLINSSINKDVIQYHVVDKQNTMTYKLGDVNNDGKISAVDVAQIRVYEKGNKINTFDKNAYARYAGDANGDGKITSDDIDLVQNYNVGIITTFPAGTPLEEKTITKEIIDVNPDTFLVENSIEKGQTHEYEIIMWISNAATNNDIYVNGYVTKPIEYKYALNLEAYDEKSENAEIVPILNIPVGTNGIEKITHEIDDTLQVGSRFATEYRYRGGSSAVNNYVYFSCSSLTEQNGENCNTARIIGVIPTEDTDGNVENRLKIILTNDIGDPLETSWDENYSNNWAVSSLNGYLNAMEGLLGMLTDVDRSMIGTTKYYLGGYHNAEVSSDEMWQIERKNESNASLADSNPVMQNDASKKIALMYASDYGYAASKECKEFLSSYSSNSVCQDDNWLHNTGNVNEWIITHDSEYEQFCYAISADGDIAYHVGVNAVQLGVRPVLTLSSNVKISGGSGTSDDPYQLSI